MKKLLFIYNPTSGRGMIKNHMTYILDLFTKGGYMVTTLPTLQKDDCKKYIVDYAVNFDLIVISGGDGTLNEATNGLMQISKENRPPIGYIPAGTVNDLASSLSLPKQAKKAAKVITEGVLFPYDISSFNDRYFNYVAAFGALTEVSYETPQNIKNLFGKTAYVLEAIKRLHSIQRYEMKIESKEGLIKGTFIYGMICNTYSVGGFLKLKDKKVALDDGYLEAIFVEMPANPLALQETINDLLTFKTDSIHYKYIHSPYFNIEISSPCSWTLDGEFGGNVEKITVKDNPCAVSFIVPDKNKKK